MDITKETDDSLLGMYQADGSRGYSPVVYKDGKRVL